jgi:hypothetical protein
MRRVDPLSHSVHPGDKTLTITCRKIAFRRRYLLFYVITERDKRVVIGLKLCFKLDNGFSYGFLAFECLDKSLSIFVREAA